MHQHLEGDRQDLKHTKIYKNIQNDDEAENFSLWDGKLSLDF